MKIGLIGLGHMGTPMAHNLMKAGNEVTVYDVLPANVAALKKIIDQYADIEEIVIGLPKKLSGEIGIQAEKVLAFIEEMKKSISLPIKTWDERLTTAESEKMLIAAGVSRKKRKTVIDKSAATFILQGYLDRQGRR